MITVDHTCPCIACDYDLNGFSRDARCPECGTPVHASHHGPTLDRADPHWARRVRSGQRQIAWASTLLTLGVALGALTALVFVLRVFHNAHAVVRVGGLVVGPLLIVGFTLLISGGVRVTAREPSTYPEMPERRACRGFLWALLAMVGLLSPAPLYYALLGPIPKPGVWAIDALLLSLTGCALMLAYYASRYLSRLAVRARSKTLPRRVRSSAIMLVAASALTALSTLPSYTGTPRWSQEPDRYYIVAFGVVLTLAILAAGRFSVVMLRLSGAIGRVRVG